ncbi:hypothetical protein GALL_446050 [mine drainage metagenome]|uniref:Uncharacterized protein n=1 Tax=mine drainage metagenome TaxID=410659 RepID=A0A1J5Q160_9ZZZZ
MVKHRRIRVVGVGLARIGDHFLGKIERLAVAAKDGRGAADATSAAVVQKAVERAPVAAQNRGCNFCHRIGAQARHQFLDEPMRRQRGVALQVHHDVKPAPKPVIRLGAAFGAVLALLRGHHHLGTEALGNRADTVVVGCDHDAVGTANRHRGLP